MKLCTILIALLLQYINCTAQQYIDSFPFSLDKKLLTFKVTINDTLIDAAFDTGAGATVSNSIIDEALNIKLKRSKVKVEDANQQVKRINKVKFSTLSIGNINLGSLNCLSTDMPFLKCANLLLLGQDVIKQLHWKFDFTKKIIYVSKDAFIPDNTMATWNYTLKGGRPHIPLAINKSNSVKCLIDFGYVGVLDINDNVATFNNYYTQQAAANKVVYYYNASMGLTGLGQSKENAYTIIDSIDLGNISFKNIYAAKTYDTDTKIGVQFFSRFCNTLIINPTTKNYYLSTKPNTNIYTYPATVRINIKDGQLVVTDLAKNNTQFTIGEIIKKVNGKTLEAFGGECDFIRWNYLAKKETFTIEKMDGTLIEVKN